MAKTILLDTRTSSFLDLVGNGRRYVVPPFQRDYSWEEEQWEDLWNDIETLRASPSERHYMGAFVVESASDREFKIIDGQQRLATLTLLALAVIKRLLDLAAAGIDPDANRTRAESLRGIFIGVRDPASLIESSKLTLNETDDPFFKDYLVQLRSPYNPRGLSKSNRQLWECFQWFLRQLQNGDEAPQNGEAIASLLSETVARQLLFILITVDDDLNAYTVFETLNARGLELSSTDLLKNYLFSKIRVRADLEALHRRWRRLIGIVRQERFPEFLRYHLLCEQPKVRAQRLFKLVRDKVGTPAEVFTLLEALERRAELFAALGDASHGFWLERPECTKFIRELMLFKARQMTPVLFAGWERFSREEFTRLLRVVTIITFRYTIVSHLNPNELEPAYHGAAKAILDGTAPNASAAFQLLRRVYVEDEKFEQDFSSLIVETTGQGRRLARYILCRLEEDASGIPRDFDSDPGSIEHILPENPLDAWEADYPRAQWESDVYRIGNLLLLEPAINREVGNRLFPEKRVAYPASAYQLPKDVVQRTAEIWNPATLVDRQRHLASRAGHLWRIDF